MPPKKKRAKVSHKSRTRSTSEPGTPSRSSSSSSSSSSASSSSSSSDERRKRRRKNKRARKRSATVSQNVLLSSVIPEFDPLVDDIHMWVNVVDANARAFEWSDKVTKYQALQKLRNTAKTWYDSLQRNETMWTTWKWKHWRNKMLDTFQVSRNMHSLLVELINVKPVEGQSLYEFYFQQKGRIDRLRLAFKEKDVISIIVGSIGDKSICTAAEAGNFKYCDELASF